MKKEFIFLFFILLVALFPGSFALLSAEEERVLEIAYPQIPGVPTPKYVTSGLPEYVNYIFRFSVILIGFLIFGALIYQGISYLLSLGNPQKLSEAKKGIFAAFLGGIILLSAYLIFTTINPQLVILKPAEITPIEPTIISGVYLCNYKAEKIEKAGEKKVCFKVISSGNLANFEIKKDSTLIIVPSEKKIYDPETKKTKSEWESNYGIVFHEKDNFGGECKLLPEPIAGNVYRPILLQPELKFTARSITLFQKPTTLPPASANGVILYQGLAFNEIGAEKKEEKKESQLLPSSFFVLAGEEDPSLAKKEFKPSEGVDIKKVSPGDLDVPGKESLKENTRSIEIDPENYYFALLFEKDNFEGKCQLKKSDDASLSDDPIGRCGTCSIWSYLKPWEWGEGCHSCLQSMYVVTGQTL